MSLLLDLVIFLLDIGSNMHVFFPLLHFILQLVPAGFNAAKFGGDTPYSIMFGPDVCGTATRKTHVIFTHEGKNHLVKKTVKVETDKLSHQYTLVVRPDNTYEVLIDGTSVEKGPIEDDFDILPPKTIKDPKASKPSDWVDEATIPDPTDVKPAGYDDVPAKIVDPAAKKPEDWDDEEDGVWEAPQIDNPDYKGPWVQKRITNPDYKGPWIHPEISNPEYAPNPELYNVCTNCAAVGFELWQVKSGTIFDDIIVADSLADVDAFSKEAGWASKKDAEKAAYDAKEKAKADAAAAAAKAAEAAKETAAEEDDEEL
jgi:calreticulin